MRFEDVFAEDRRNLERVMAEDEVERAHIRRGMWLAESIEWQAGNRGNEFHVMLGPAGILLFDQTLERIKRSADRLGSAELRDPGLLVRNLMTVHDLGKYDAGRDELNGTGHEVRSAQIVWSKRAILVERLGWDPRNVELVRELARHHNMLGTMRIGEASIWSMLPILESIKHFDADRKRLFLDLLIILTCCDAGASGDFRAGAFYLDASRIQLYRRIADELLEAARQPDYEDALLARAVEFEPTLDRIDRILTSGNAGLFAGDGTIRSALKQVMDEGYLDLRRFAVRRFDHGFYVFEPLLVELAGARTAVPAETLYKFLVLLGALSETKVGQSVISFRSSFSMKEDLRHKNEKGFYELVDAVRSGEVERIRGVLAEFMGA